MDSNSHEQRVHEQSSWLYPTTRTKLAVLSFGFALVTLLVAELIYSILVTDVGRYWSWKRLIADAAAGFIVGSFAAQISQQAYRLRLTTISQMEMVAEANHHIRTALDSIEMSAENQQAIRVIGESAERIDLVLRELAPHTASPAE